MTKKSKTMILREVVIFKASFGWTPRQQGAVWFLPHRTPPIRALRRNVSPVRDEAFSGADFFYFVGLKQGQ
ncbi:Uncharacterized protein TCM_014681 [Theobroma cacao]|uniref:Uncharacterized protein n=1 Tax=Theobroma cacao TaxID=3641 RepID=A0A061G026_THECC|nr:Uncharacterized protein TCM_014681 [Theobroma cacao]